MAKQVRCEQGTHYYNPEQHSKCPFCRQVNINVGKTKPMPRDDAERKASHTKRIQDTTDGVDDGRTRRVSPSSDVKGVEPVVGWLVCVDGSNQGRDYRIKSGGNTIGRDSRNDIQITGDSEISREAHATIQYEPKKSQFFFIPNTSKNPTYVNGDSTLMPTGINRGDTIEIGNTKLIFVPFCDDDFRWGAFGDQKGD